MVHFGPGVIKNDSTYYATQTVDGCESLTSLAVEVALITGIEGTGSPSLLGYPNPTSKQFRLTSELTMDEVQVVNLIGQPVMSLKINSNDITIDLSTLPQSAYFIFVKIGMKRAVLRVIKN